MSSTIDQVWRVLGADYSIDSGRHIIRPADACDARCWTVADLRGAGL
jgi:hypothetical protein